MVAISIQLQVHNPLNAKRKEEKGRKEEKDEERAMWTATWPSSSSPPSFDLTEVMSHIVKKQLHLE